MLIVDLDANNSLIAIEKRESDATHLMGLKKLHDEQKIMLRISAIGASERRQRRSNHEIRGFTDRVKAAGLDGCKIVLPMARLDLTFLDYSILVDQKMIELETAIHKILHPTIPYNYQNFCLQYNIDPSEGILGDWSNAICDTQAIWCHIHYKGDIFVSADKNYRKKTKLPKLMKLGVKKILTPHEAATLFGSSV